MQIPVDFHLGTETQQAIIDLDGFKKTYKGLGKVSPGTLLHFRRTATIESIGSSTRIEGSRLSDQEVSRLLDNLRIDSFRDRDEEEVGGYAAAMELISDSWDSIPINENHIRQLHRILLQYSQKDTRHRGEYKTLPNHVAAFDADGKQIGIVFETASPFDTPFQMEELTGWFSEMEKSGEAHPLVAIGVFVVRFLAIHPFQDGNGRLSRLLTTLMLLRAGYDYVPYASLESIIEENKAGYYDALRRTQKSMKGAVVDWNPWLSYFMRCLVRQKDRIVARVEKEIRLATATSELGAKILRLLSDHRTMNISAIGHATLANRNTLKASLASLVKRGAIVQQGRGRGAYYVLAS